MKVSKRNEPIIGRNSCQSEPLPETHWWITFLKGDDVALAHIYRAYAPKLFNYGRQFTPHDSLVQDAIQDVFFQLVDNRSKLAWPSL